MNFITRNLGWLLLLLFFLFMLFVISSNDVKKDQNTQLDSSSGATLELSEDASDEIDVLEEMLDESEEGIMKSSDEEDGHDDEDDKQEEEKQGFFSRLFGKSNSDEVGDSDDFIVIGEMSDITDENLEDEKESSDEDKENKEDEEDESEEEKEGFFSKIFGKDDSAENLDDKDTPREDANLVKDTGEKKISQEDTANISTYAPEILKKDIVYPGVDLETQPGKEFEIGVHSLKLNNKSFNETLAYMLKGDRVKQITDENSYGCFEVQLLTSALKKNIGKTGYVCKKYLQDVQDVSISVENSEENIVEQDQENMSSGDTEVNPEENTTSSAAPKTNIGDIIKIQKPKVVFDGITLIAGDCVDQMTQIDAEGCFMAHVYQTSIGGSMGQVGKLCLKDIY